MKNKYRLIASLMALLNPACGHTTSMANRSSTFAIENGGQLDLAMAVIQKEIAGAQIRGYSYNGSIPGPVIKVGQGSTIRLVLSNQTDLDTTLHPHGVRLDNKFDGIPGVTQEPIKPGESFTYQLKFPDAGVYWYHPHVKDWYTRELGAYGAFLVTSESPTYFNPVNREEILMLSDISISDGQVELDDSDNPTHVLMGRFGNTMLINGETTYKLNVQRGEVVRFYLLNAADARPFNFQIQGAKMKVVGSDIGKSIREAWADSILIAPAERYIIEALFDRPGEYAIFNKTPEQSVELGRIIVEQQLTDNDFRDVFAKLKENDDVKSDIEQYRRFFNKPIDRKLVMSMSMVMGGGDHEGHQMHSTHMGDHDNELSIASAEQLPLWERTNDIEWEDTMPGMNAGSTLENVTWKLIDPATKKENMDIQWEFTSGKPVKIELFNDPRSMHPMQHPIHFHGQRFLVLSVNGQQNPILQWKDTVLVRPGERIQILLDASNPGDWMFHCHIGRHSVQQGHIMTMMGNFRVIQNASARRDVQ